MQVTRSAMRLGGGFAWMTLCLVVVQPVGGGAAAADAKSEKPDPVATGYEIFNRAGGADEMLRLWDTPSGSLRAALRGHFDVIDWVAFSSDGRTLFTASGDATIKLWDPSATRAVGGPGPRR
jgi:WD40 repeat protein